MEYIACSGTELQYTLAKATSRKTIDSKICYVSRHNIMYWQVEIFGVGRFFHKVSNCENKSVMHVHTIANHENENHTKFQCILY